VGLDFARDRIPVGPAAHYVMGGVETDLHGRTSLPGLFAAGEVACTRVHGANRLASNSLLEGLVFGARAGRAMCQPLAAASLPSPEFRSLTEEIERGRQATPLAEDAIRDLMWRSAGLFRNGDGLRDAMRTLDAAYLDLENSLTAQSVTDLAGWRRANLLTVARLVVRGAMRRQESRGAHFRSDFPATDDLHWKTHLTDVNETEARRLGIGPAANRAV
jgi:L-aspartate oxidase